MKVEFEKNRGFRLNDLHSASKQIERAFYFGFRDVGNMGINFGRIHRFVSEQFLDIPDIRTVFQQVGSKAVAQGMRSHFFGDARF